MTGKASSQKAYNYIVIGQVLLFFFLFVCIALIPHFLFEKNEGGISNYGIYTKTIVPFSLSTLSGAGFAVLATKYLADREFSRYLNIWALLAIISLISTYPYKVNHVYGHIHQYTSILFVIYEIVFAGWLAFKHVKNHVSQVFWYLQVIGFIFGILNNFGVVHLLFIVEVWEGLTFAVILVRSVRSLLILN